MNAAACPFCNCSVVDDGRLAGTVVSCPNCNREFQMPAMNVASFAQPSVNSEAVTRRLEQQLVRLEKLVHRWRRISKICMALLILPLMLTGLLVFLFTLGMVAEAPLDSGMETVIRTRRLELVDEDGKTMGVLVGHNGASIFLGDSTNFGTTGGVFIRHERNGNSSVALYRKTGTPAVSIGLVSGDGGNLSIFNPAGKEVAIIQSNKKNSGLVVLNDFDGNFVRGLVGEK